MTGGPRENRGIEPFASVSQLRKTHFAMLEAETTNEERLSLEQISEFLKRVAITGRHVQKFSERDTARGIMDFWRARLHGNANARLEFAPYERSMEGERQIATSPYMGVQPFNESDQESFYGREEAIEQLVNKLRQTKCLILYGVSCCGKTSLVEAGVVPRLKSDLSQSGKAWHCLPKIRPGADPVGALLRAACPEGDDTEVFARENRSSLVRAPNSYREIVSKLPAIRSAQSVLVFVDDFDDIVSFAGNLDERSVFNAALASLVQAEEHDIRIILGIQSARLSECEGIPEFKAYFANNDAYFSPPLLGRDHISDIVNLPARDVGLNIEEAVVKDLARRLSGEPSYLSLLQFVLRNLWDRRQGNHINSATYDTLGNPIEMLKRAADVAYDKLATDENRKAAKGIFLRLVEIAPLGSEDSNKTGTNGLEFMRTRARLQDLKNAGQEAAVRNALRTFMAAGLIRRTRYDRNTDADHLVDNDVFEVVHKSLIRAWPTLEGWLRDQQATSKEQLRLRAQHRAWVRSGREEAYLLHGKALKNARKYQEEASGIKELVVASDDRKKRVRNLAAGTVIVAIGAAILGSLAYRNYDETRKNTTNPDRIDTIIISILPESADEEKEKYLKEVSILLGNAEYRRPRLYFTNNLFPNLDLSAIVFRTPADFIRSRLIDVSFRGATIPNAFFNKSVLDNVDFSGAVLAGASFREAKIIGGSSFVDADLGLASFDNAMLCGVNLAGAKIPGASFTGVPYEKVTANSLRDTQWWTASGWTPEWLENFPTFTGSQAPGGAVAEAFQTRLAASRQKYLDEPNKLSWKAVFALNEFAWENAFWGGKLVPSKNTPDLPNCEALKEVPDNAKQTAAAAICLAKKMHQEEQSTSEFQQNVANLYHTLGYVLLLSGDIQGARLALSEALQHFQAVQEQQQASRVNEATSAAINRQLREIEFKLEIAKGKPESSELNARRQAFRRLFSSTWLPSQEIARLKSLMKDFEIKDLVYDELEKRLPRPPKLDCPKS